MPNTPAFQSLYRIHAAVEFGQQPVGQITWGHK